MASLIKTLSFLKRIPLIWLGPVGEKGFKFAAAVRGYLVDRCIPVAGYKKAAFRGDGQIVETGRKLGEFLPFLPIQAEPVHRSAELREVGHLVRSHFQGDGGGKFFSDRCNVACIRIDPQDLARTHIRYDQIVRIRVKAEAFGYRNDVFFDQKSRLLDSRGIELKDAVCLEALAREEPPRALVILDPVRGE